MSELPNTIQVYPIDETGTITTSQECCLQELKFAGMQLEKECWIGIGVTCAAEFQVYDDCIMVSVRGLKAGYGLGKAESCVRIVNYVDDGSRLLNLVNLSKHLLPYDILIVKVIYYGLE